MNSVKTTAPTSITTPLNRNGNNVNSSVTSSNYYYNAQNPIHGKQIKVNIDNVWNPVDSYIYGPTQNSIFNQQDHKFRGLSPQNSEKFGNSLTSAKETTLNYAGNIAKTEKTGYGTTSADMSGRSSGGSGSGVGSGGTGGSSRSGGTTKFQKYVNSRKLIAELYDNETPRLCDHSLLEEIGKRMRPCSPIESYVSTARDMVIY